MPNNVIANRKRWIEALRSGRYPRGRFCFEFEFGSAGRVYCPLGVMLKEFSHEVATGDGNPVAISFSEMISIMYRNDVEGHSFNEIADYIESLPIHVEVTSPRRPLIGRMLKASYD